MSSFDKTVKLACKPKAAPPKAKYLDPIIAATYSEDGSIHDVCKALVPRLREPNSTVVFKALIVLHTMIRNGATDNVLSYLASDDILKLRSVSTGHWEGYDTPRNLQSYALYLDSRIRVFKELKHDPVRVQSDTNRDTRVESALQSPRNRIGSNSSGPQRSKTIMGRKLRAMTVEKGLLRETKAVQKCVNVLVDCTFFLDNLEDELNVTALRMLVKDLLILFQALNEGVINVLEYYFEMSRVDAETALGIYRNFCKQTDRAVEYLSIASKLQNLLQVQIPNLRHAPVSLIKSLEEYINDPNFEQNRIEYKTAKALADKNAREGKIQPAKNSEKDKSNVQPTAQKIVGGQAASTSQGKYSNHALVDFFSSIEGEQTVALIPQPTGQTQQQHVPHNPFAQRQPMMVTGAFPQQQPFAQTQVPQMTGFMQPQPTATPNLPFQQPPTLQPRHHPFSAFIQSQAPQPMGFLQPQATGINPFRQSMLIPQMTDIAALAGTNANTVQNPVSQHFYTAQSALVPGFAPIPVSNAVSSPPNIFGSTNESNVPNNVPQRPASTPLTSTGNALAQDAMPVVAHQTGSKNPFGIPQRSPPPIPKLPTLRELVTGAAMDSINTTSSTPSSSGLFNPQSNMSMMPLNSNPQSQSSTQVNASAMSSVASSFTLGNTNGINSSNPVNDTFRKSSLTTLSNSTLALMSQPTGLGSTAPPVLPPLQPQNTGFVGIKPFKPTSSFGASLLESLPPILHASTSDSSTVNSNTGQTRGSGIDATLPGISSFSQSTLSPQVGSLFGGLNSGSESSSANLPSSSGLSFSQPASASGLPSMSNNKSVFGSSLGVGLRPQATGTLGGANPFRASMFSSTSGVSVPPSQFGTSFSNPTNLPFSGNVFHGSSSGDTLKQQNGNSGPLF